MDLQQVDVWRVQALQTRAFSPARIGARDSLGCFILSRMSMCPGFSAVFVLGSAVHLREEQAPLTRNLAA